MEKFHSPNLPVTYLKPYSLRHITKAELFNFFNRNGNEACEAEDEAHASVQSLDDEDFSFDEINQV